MIRIKNKINRRRKIHIHTYNTFICSILHPRFTLLTVTFWVSLLRGEGLAGVIVFPVVPEKPSWDEHHKGFTSSTGDSFARADHFLEHLKPKTVDVWNSNVNMCQQARHTQSSRLLAGFWLLVFWLFGSLHSSWVPEKRSCLRRCQGGKIRGCGAVSHNGCAKRLFIAWLLWVKWIPFDYAFFLVTNRLEGNCSLVTNRPTAGGAKRGTSTHSGLLYRATYDSFEQQTLSASGRSTDKEHRMAIRGTLHVPPMFDV